MKCSLDDNNVYRLGGKGGLSERRKILLAENGFYNQQYCGCEFSFRKPQNNDLP